VSTGVARSLPLSVAGTRADGGLRPDPGTALSRREATLRSAAATCLVGIALVQAIELPFVLSRGAQPAVLSIAGMALCVALALALAAAPGGASRQVWRAVAAMAALVLATWAVPHAVGLPQVPAARGHWTSMPGAACAAAAAACLLLAAAAARPTMRGVATAMAVLAALAPGTGALLVALGPGPPGGEAAIASGVHAHAASNGVEPNIRAQPGANGTHFVTVVRAPPRPPAVAVALVVAAGVILVLGAVGCLHRRTAP